MSAVNPPASSNRYSAAHDGLEAYESIGLQGLLAATEKVRAVHSGLAEPDDREATYNDRIYTPDRLMAERFKLDNGKVLRKMMGRLNYKRSLRGMGPDVFSAHTMGYLKSNPLVNTMEQVNPIDTMDQRMRITKLGPGGIGDPNAVTIGLQCHSADTEVFTYAGWKLWPDVTMEDRLACRIDGRIEFHPPEKIHCGHYNGKMYFADTTQSVRYCVTPNHRFFSVPDIRALPSSWKWETAEEQFGKGRVHMVSSLPYAGTDPRDFFDLPQVDAKAGAQGSIKRCGPIPMGDWCEFLGWYMSEGSCYHTDTNSYTVTISQCPEKSPAEHARIAALLERLPINFCLSQGKNFRAYSKDLYHYVRDFEKQLTRRMPEFLFEVKPEYRQRFLESYELGDGRSSSTGSGDYNSSSEVLMDQTERLALGMGFHATRSNPWLAKKRDGTDGSWLHRVGRRNTTHSKVLPKHLSAIDYSGMVYCATVPGGLLLTRLRKQDRAVSPFWSGNSVHGSQFGFIDPLGGPECCAADMEVYTSGGWVPWPLVADTDLLACLVGESVEFHLPVRIVRQDYEGEMLVAETPSFRMVVTPTHRVLAIFSQISSLSSVIAAHRAFDSAMTIPATPSPAEDEIALPHHLVAGSWRRESYAGKVYCATVPGGFLYVRGSSEHRGYWTGNSEKAGVDIRITHGTHIGSDGQLYQVMNNLKTGKQEWVSPTMLKGKVIKLPD